MKRSFFSFLLFGFSLLVVGVSIWRSRAPMATLAADASSSPEEEMVIVSEMKPETEEYPLPYPGFLPDHPLYFLKMTRDRIQLWFTGQPLARAKLLLHYSDKRISASLALAEKGKVGLAVSTATKAEKYLTQAIDAAKLAETRGDNTKDFYRQLFAATEQHEKVLLGVMSRTPDEAQAVVESALAINERSHKEIESIFGW